MISPNFIARVLFSFKLICLTVQNIERKKKSDSTLYNCGTCLIACFCINSPNIYLGKKYLTSCSDL